MDNKFSVCEIMEIAVRIEENGKDFYAALSKMSDSPELKKTFDYLADMEKEHIETFRGMSQNECSYEPKEVYPEEYFAYMKDLASQFVFTQKNKGKEIAENVKDVIDGMELAISLEKDSILFYEEAKKHLQDNAKADIEKIINEEKKHVSLLTDLFIERNNKTE
ncbi:MAG: ferritin family protein [Candidatus Omnitrophota bacterium]